MEIGAPPPLKATAGRMNRDGVSFLYLASEQNTAVAEVRPHPGQIVSIGKFTTNCELIIADFNAIEIYDYFLNDKLLDAFSLLKSIDVSFSMPIPPDQRHNYSLTQFLSDLLRTLNFDGIAYRSSIGSGFNVTIFDPEKFQYVPGSEGVVKIEKLNYSWATLQTVSMDEEYMMYKDGKAIY